MLPLAAAGYHVVAPDQRGYGRTTGWDADYDGDLGSFRLLNLGRDVLGLVSALGYRSVEAVIGHDFGSPVAAYCALARPDVFRAVALMSAPFGGTPALPFDTANEKPAASTGGNIHADLAALESPRKHYQWYYSTREADANMHKCPQGVHAFLRAYYHHKSADWPDNKPYKLAGWTATELAKMPTYYIMDLAEGMAETVAPEMPSEARSAPAAGCPRTSCASIATSTVAPASKAVCSGIAAARPAVTAPTWKSISGRTIDVPSCYIAGKSDWGIYQRPGDFERMQTAACTNMLACHLVDGAGHWVQQEQPEATSRLLLDFLAAARSKR